MYSNSNSMYTYVYVACVILYGVVQYKYVYNYCHEETNVEVAWNLCWIMDRCNGDDERKVWWCNGLYKYLQIYMYIYKYVQKVLFSAKRTFLLVSHCLFYIFFWKESCMLLFFSQKVVELAFLKYWVKFILWSRFWSYWIQIFSYNFCSRTGILFCLLFGVILKLNLT